MFSGLIEHLGRVEAHAGNRLAVSLVLKKVKRGDSISINGVCLTATTVKRAGKKTVLSFDVAQETYDKTTLTLIRVGDTVNVEPSLTLNQALGGHLVQGHVDGVGRLEQMEKKDVDWSLVFSAPEELLNGCVLKGSIAIDGVSLTVAGLGENGFGVAMIPYTREHTTFRDVKVGQFVNLETDVIGKYVARYLKK